MSRKGLALLIACLATGTGFAEGNDFNFVPFDLGGDYYSFEVSDLDVYNLDQQPFSTTISIVGGPDLRAEDKNRSSNDVLAFRGNGSSSGGFVTPSRIGDEAVSVRCTVGLFTTGRRQKPLRTGINAGETVAFTGIGAVGGNDFLFAGVAPRKDGTQVFARDNTRLLTNVFLDDVFAVELDLEKGVQSQGGQDMSFARLSVRPAGSDDPFDLLVEELFPVFDDPFPQGLDTIFGVDGLDEDGQIFFDNIFVSGLEGIAEAAASELLDDAFELEVSAFVELFVNPDGAKKKIQRAVKKLKKAKRSLKKNRKDLSPTTDLSRTRAAIGTALDLDQQVLDAIEGGDATEADRLLIEVTTEKARAELFLQGHDPGPGPFEDGVGGFDLDDPIFVDGFESGDVSAWSLTDR